MFATVGNESLLRTGFWQAALRLNDETGGRLATYVQRRKVGALGDREFERRSSTIEYFVGGSHALSCEAALSPSGSFGISRKTFEKYFKEVCNRTNAHYAQHFER